MAFISPQNLLDSLVNSPFFEDLPRNVVEALCKKLTIVEMGLNYEVINKGDEGDSMYIILSGKVKIHDQHLTLTELSAGAVFGEMALIDNSTRSMSVSTLTECQMGVLSREDFYDVMKNYPDIFKYLISTLSNRLRNQNEVLLNQYRKRENELTELVKARTEELEKRNELNIDVFGNFSKEVVKKFTLGAMLGFNYNRKSLTDIYGQTQNGLVIPGYYNLNNSKDKPVVQTQYSNEGLVGVFGQLTFGYNNILFGEFTARNDWSSTLPSGKRGFAYFSGGLSFVPTEFIKGDAKEWINYLKLRVNAGTQGKGADPYRLNSVYAASQFLTDYFGNNLPNNFPVVGLDGSTVSGYTVGNQIGNPDLKPELTVAYDAGVDITFLKEYVHTEYTFYHKTHKDLIVQASLPASSGYTTQILNNKGTVLKTNTSGDEITIGGLTTVSVVAKEGYPFGTFKANDFQKDPNGNIIVGANGAPIASSTQNIFGSFQADYTVGFGSSFSWKGLSFDIQFDIRKGGLFYSGTKNATDFNGTSLSSLVNNRNPYIIPNSVVDIGDGTFTPNTTPITNLYNYVGNLPESQDLIDASYIKLREASISYSFDKKFFKKAPVSGITLSVIGNNLKFWLPKQNVYADPETNSFGQAGNVQGIEFSSTPTTRTVSVDLKIKF